MQKIAGEQEISSKVRALTRSLIPAGMLGVVLVLIGVLVFVLSDFVPLPGGLLAS